jgi:hypothetical protein
LAVIVVRVLYPRVAAVAPDILVPHPVDDTDGRGVPTLIREEA